MPPLHRDSLLDSSFGRQKDKCTKHSQNRPRSKKKGCVVRAAAAGKTNNRISSWQNEAGLPCAVAFKSSLLLGLSLCLLPAGASTPAVHSGRLVSRHCLGGAQATLAALYMATGGGGTYREAIQSAGAPHCRHLCRRCVHVAGQVRVTRSVHICACVHRRVAPETASPSLCLCC